MTRTYDYIVVGAGSAGCILAHRLTEGGKYTVLLLEAGGSDDALRFKVPIGYVFTYYDKRSNWMYYSQPEKELNNRSLYVPRGKVQGGSGSINAMIYIRGQKSDFNDWSALGNTGWAYEDVLPYYKRLEAHWLGDTEYHRSNGRIHITQMKPEAHPICNAFLDACKGLGYPLNDDFNGASMEGVGIYDINTNGGLRDSSSRAYLQEALNNTQLTVEHHCLVDKILFDGQKRATGVSFVQGVERRRANAGREVIIAAGAVDSPKLLQLSGVGDPALLQQHGITVVHASPAVGKNLQDHVCASYYYKANRKTLNDVFNSCPRQSTGGAAVPVESQRTVVHQRQPGRRIPENRRRAGSSEPAALFQPAVVWDTEGRLEEPAAGSRYSGFLVAFSPCRPTSRGSVEIASNQAVDAPLIRPNFLTTQKDIDGGNQGQGSSSARS